MTEAEICWLAGLLEGEGTFLKASPSRPNSPTVSLEMTDEDVVARVAHLLGNKKYQRYDRSTTHPNWKVTYRVFVRGKYAVALMSKIRQYMGLRRKKQIDDALSTYGRAKRVGIAAQNVALITGCLAEGLTHQSIANQLGVDRSTVSQFLRRSAAAIGRSVSRSERA